VVEVEVEVGVEEELAWLYDQSQVPSLPDGTWDCTQGGRAGGGGSGSLVNFSFGGEGEIPMTQIVRTGPDQWIPVGRPEYLRQECEMSLRRLKVDRIELFQLHRIDPKVPAGEQFGLLRDLQKKGKVHHIGLSEVSVAEIEAARKVVRIATVQNMYNLQDRKAEPVVDYCDREGIGRSKVILPIPGTSSVSHVEENCGAGAVKLTDAQFETLRKIAS
jgi:aryl-alcohol dehydrogenase-like predicted oxidoreductase